MKAIVTGSRRWKSVGVIELALLEHGVTFVVEGGCPTGADLIARELAERMGLEHKRVDADWGRFGRSAGPRRNQQMLDEHPDAALVLSFWLPGSRGTADMMDRARAQWRHLEEYPKGEAGHRCTLCGDPRCEHTKSEADWRTVPGCTGAYATSQRQRSDRTGGGET